MTAIRLGRIWDESAERAAAPSITPLGDLLLFGCSSRRVPAIAAILDIPDIRIVTAVLDIAAVPAIAAILDIPDIRVVPAIPAASTAGPCSAARRWRSARLLIARENWCYESCSARKRRSR